MIALFASALLLSAVSVIPEISEVPVETAAHDQSGAQFTNFTRVDSGAAPRETTRLTLSYSRTHLYLTGEASSFALDPTSNMADRFKAIAVKRDADLSGDDSVELIFDTLNHTQYLITINALGTLRDVRLASGAAPNSGWNADIMASAERHEGGWRFRMAIAWESLGIRPSGLEKGLSLQAIRHDSGSGERSSLGGEPIQLRFGGNSAYGYTLPFPIPLNATQPVAVRMMAREGSVVAWKREALRGDAVVGEASGSQVVAQTPFDLQLPGASHRKKGGDRERISVLIDGHLILQSPVYPSRDERMSVNVEAAPGSTPFTLSCNGEAVVRSGSFRPKAAFSVAPGMNELLLHTDADTFPEFRIETPAGPLANDAGQWEKLDAQGAYRRFIASRATRFSPRYESDAVCALTAGGTQFFQWDGGALEEWNFPGALKNYRLILDLPAGLELLGASGTEHGLYRWEKLGEIRRNGEPYQRYAIHRAQPVRLTAGKEEWLAREQRRREGVVFAIGNRLREGDGGTIYYGMEATAKESGAPVAEVANALRFQTLAQAKGVPPRGLVFSLYSRLGVVADPDLQRRLFETFHEAGVNEFFGQTASPLPREIGLRQSTFFGLGHTSWVGFRPGMLKMDALFERYPEARAIAFDGKTMLTPCLSWLARHDEATPYLETALAELLATNPGMSHLFWDYEFPPFPEGIHAYPMFSAFGLQTFRDAYSIQEPLTPELIRERYAEQWVAFTCGEVAGIAKKLGALAKRRGVALTMYSGYQSAYTQRRYNVDWSKLAPALDYAYCGYTRDGAAISATREALGRVPLVGGLLAMGPSAPRPTVATILRTLGQHRGGVLFWYEGGGYDGGTLVPIARASQLVAGHEETILNGADATALLALPASAQGSALLVRHQSVALLFLWNEGSAEKTISIPLPEAFRQSHRLDGAALPEVLTRTLPPGEAMLLSLEGERHE